MALHGNQVFAAARAGCVMAMARGESLLAAVNATRSLAQRHASGVLSWKPSSEIVGARGQEFVRAIGDASCRWRLPISCEHVAQSPMAGAAN